MKYFGTDGIRDKAEHIIERKIAYYLGKSISLLNTSKKPVYIARDTRISGKKIVQDLKKGLFETGIAVCDLGVFPTPVLAYHSLINESFGIMVTASHNPYHDNGIKIFVSGEKLDPKHELLIENVIDQIQEVDNILPKGKDIKVKNPLNDYLTLYKGLLGLTDKTICLDLANGAAISTAEFIFSQISNDLLILSDNANGKNINKDCGSTHLDLLKKHVIEDKCDLGIAFDGDADRLMVIDDLGDVCDGDFLIYLFAIYLKEHDLLTNNFVALSKMCNIGIVNALNNKGIEVIQTDVGDKYISKAMDDFKGVLGGENSGHIINRHLFVSGDGVLNAAYLIKVLEHYNKNLSELKKEVTYYPDTLVNLRDLDRSLVNHIQVQELISKHLNDLGKDGKILVRASGTEPLIRISASAPTEEQVNTIIDEIKSLIESLAKDGK